jgi:hypothetical protein
MATAKWATPGTRSADLSGSVLNVAGGIANGAETGTMTYDNSTARDLYGTVTIKLASLTPTTGASVTLRVQYNDGTDAPNGKFGGDLYTSLVLTGTGTKTVMFNMVRLYPYSMLFSVINNTGTTIPATGNNFYVRPWNEEVL